MTNKHPHYRLYHHWSLGTLLVCVAVIVLCALGCTAAFALVREQTAELLAYASHTSGVDYENHVSYIELALLASVPAVVIGVAVWLIDRWEPEPAILYVIAILWGAGVSVIWSFAGNSAWRDAVREWTTSRQAYDFWATAVGAPVIEELVKAVGLLLVFFVFTRYVNGPMDGIVYGLLIGMGFSFTENLLYFSRAAVAQDLAGGVDLSGLETWTVGAVFVQRAIVSPLVHPLATAITGLFVGLASNRRHSRLWALPFACGGYVLASLLHGLHNWSTFRVGADTAVRLMLQIPVYIGAIVVIYYVAGLQRKAVLLGLRSLADDGAVNPSEIPMVMNLANRTRARAWAERAALSRGHSAGEGRRAMRDLQNELISAAYSRTMNRVRGVSDSPKATARERATIVRLAQYREVFGGVA